MFDNIKEACRMFFKSRLVVATVVMILLFSILLWRIFSDCKWKRISGQLYVQNRQGTHLKQYTRKYL